MPSGRLAFATRRVDLMVASMRAALASLCGWLTILPPTKKCGKNSTRWWFEFKEHLDSALFQPSCPSRVQ
jgi:hypothetical protein